MTTLTRRQFAHGVVAHGAVALTGAAALSFLPQVSRAAQPITTLSKSASLPPPDPLFLLLSRTSFGISDAAMAHAQAIGFEAYVEQQLNPEAIDDAEVEEYVATHFPSIFLSAAELAVLEDRARSQAARQLKLATAYRRWFSRRQLYEVMAEFWTNHFNIFQDSGPLRLLKIVDDREVIRPQAMGRFRDMLHASAKSPAMLFYLDNFQNVKNGPNENYARELM